MKESIVATLDIKSKAFRLKKGEYVEKKECQEKMLKTQA